MHRPYFRHPAYVRPAKPDRPRQRRAAYTHAPFPLTVLAELLGCHASSAYRGCKKFGVRTWVRARLRERLTHGAHYAVGLEVRRTIRFNAAVLERDARFRLNSRSGHQGQPLDGRVLAQELGVASDPDFLTVWLWHLDELADALVEAVDAGHLEDLPWFKAQRYLDQTVVPRVRRVQHVDPNAEPPLPNRFGGLKRIRLMWTAVLSARDVDREWVQVDWRRTMALYPAFMDHVPEIALLDEVEPYLGGVQERWLHERI